MKTNSLDFDAQALREKILDLAMRGKLVKQDPNDEPASVLLEKIKAEKAELVKEGKIKKSKALPEITDGEKPFDIPDSWEWVRLGNVALSINDGIHFKPNYVKNGIKFATAKNISSGKLDLSKTDYISKEDYDEFAKKVSPALGDLLLSKDGTIGAAAINESKEKFGLLSSIAVVKTNKEHISNYYLSYGIKNSIIQQQIKKNIRGITYRHWNLKRINTTYIPLPPLSEQKRIAAKIAQLFALLRKVESSNQQYAKLQTLLKSKVLDLAMRGKLVEQDPNDEPASVLLEKIKAEKKQLIKEKKIKKSKPLPPITDEEKPFEIPDSWEWVRLGYVITLTSGKQLTKNRMNNSFQYSVFGANGKIGYFKKYNVNPNTILIGRVGSVGSINLTTDNTWATDNTLIVTPICKNNLSVVWLEYLLQFSNLKNLASRTSQPVISATKVGNVIIPFPPLSEQNRIAAKIAQLFALLRKDESSN